MHRRNPPIHESSTHIPECAELADGNIRAGALTTLYCRWFESLICDVNKINLRVSNTIVFGNCGFYPWIYGPCRILTVYLCLFVDIQRYYSRFRRQRHKQTAAGNHDCRRHSLSRMHMKYLQLLFFEEPNLELHFLKCAGRILQQRRAVSSKEFSILLSIRYGLISGSVYNALWLNSPRYHSNNATCFSDSGLLLFDFQKKACSVRLELVCWDCNSKSLFRSSSDLRLAISR
jgi:hypothetical protein